MKRLGLGLTSGALGLAAFAAVLATAPVASASPIAGSSLVISAERVGAASYTKVGGDFDRDYGTIALLGQMGSVSPYSAPRFAFDGQVVHHLTVGGVLTVGHYELNSISSTVVLVNPRVGFLTALGSGADLWVKGGFSYYSASTSGGFTSTDETGLALSLALDFNIALGGNAGILIGPSVDQALSGGTDTVDLKYSTYALNIGIAGWL